MFHVSGFWTATGAVITGLILADVLRNWKGSSKLFGQGTRFTLGESKILSGR